MQPMQGASDCRDSRELEERARVVDVHGPIESAQRCRRRHKDVDQGEETQICEVQ